jgi:type I restriction enzyme R subunit
VNEAETRAEYIDPQLAAAGWGVVDGSRVRREFPITLGRLEGAGRRAKAKAADYVLEYRNTKLAVVEAKSYDAPLTEGVTQAKEYTAKLAIGFGYSTNGQGVYEIDMTTGGEGEVSTFPTPQELWDRTFAEPNEWRDRFAAVAPETRGGSWTSRYYQDIAIDRVLSAIADGDQRILLTMATGTGKTFTALQIVWKLIRSGWLGRMATGTGKTAVASQVAWKLFHSRWNLNRDGGRRPRILFLADRNILADQAYNAFSAFPEDALVRIAPAEISRKGVVPKNGSIFFTIFQTFMSGPELEPHFGAYPPDFFDFIVVDECHRGGANNESTWRGILDYFAPAVQLGMTATPKRRDNVDTYAYFGEPVFTYSLKDGINDGFLTPFKVKQIATTIDEYVYVADDLVIEGEVQEGRRYTETDFNRIIEIKEREAYRVRLLMDMIDQSEKTLVFCANQEHALAIRDLINQMKTSTDPDYCVRVTADEGGRGDQFLREFQDNEKTIPTVLTTSQKLSTGVDARNIRNIVLLRPVNSMIEFKQIIGRGTRLYDGKDYFTIYDFVGAHHHFSDPEWDGEPLEPEPTMPGPPGEPEPMPEPADPAEPPERPKRAKVRLADGKERAFQSMVATTFWGADGKPLSAAQFLESLFGALPEFFRDEDQLREIWSVPETRSTLLAGLADKGFGRESLTEMQHIIEAENSDLFDVLAYVAFASQPIAREERAAYARREIHTSFSEKQEAFLTFVLSQYVREGVDELATEKLAQLLKLAYHNAIADAVDALGQPDEIRDAFSGFQRYLYER